MDLNDATMTLIESFEGFEPKWYLDPVGIRTIGYGHTDAAGDPKYARSKTLTLTRPEARALLKRDLNQYADAVTAALFLAEFVGDVPWAHVDIAGTAQGDADASWRTAGCTGFGARLLVELACGFEVPAP